MRAAVTLEPGRIAMRDVPEPAPGPGEALLAVEVVGICGSDLHFFAGDNPYANYPRTQGHEFCGIVRAFGPGYDGPIRPGDRVAVEPLRPCGACFPCRNGRPNCCARLTVLGIHADGGMADLYVAPVDVLHPTGDLDPELAAMVEPVSIGLHAVVRGAVTAQDRVAVFGAGPIGQAVLLACVDRGARVLVVDRLSARLELATALGAEVIIDAGTEDAAMAIASWTGGDGPGVVFDATGVPAVIRSIFDIVAPSGRVVIVGISTEEVSVPVIYFTRKELTILGSRNNVGVFGQSVELVRRHRERVRRLITHRFPLEQVADAFALAHDHPAEAEKVLLLVGGAR